MNELNEIIFNTVRPVIEIRALLEHDISHFPFGANKKITKFYRVECYGAQFYHWHDLGALDHALIVLVRNDQKINTRHKGCRQRVIEPVHSGSSSILKERFFLTPCMYHHHHHYRM